MKVKLSLKRFYLKLLCRLGFHDGMRAQLYEDGEILVICRRCRKELD